MLDQARSGEQKRSGFSGAPVSLESLCSFITAGNLQDVPVSWKVASQWYELHETGTGLNRLFVQYGVVFYEL